MDIGLIILAVVLIIFILLTLFFLSGRGTCMLNGLGFRSHEDLAKFNPKKMIKFLGKCMVGFDISIVLMMLGYITHIEVFSIAAAILILVVCIGATIYMKTKQRFLDED